MKTIIAGSRSIKDISTVYRAMEKVPWLVTEVVSGNAPGVDRLGENWAEENAIPVKIFPANWAKFGQGAGRIRNAEMAMYADALVAIWDGISPGTGNMIDLARAKGLKIYVEIV